MPKVIFTSDRYYFDDEEFTFFVYDLDEQKIIFKKEKIDELEFVDYELDDRPNFRPYGISQDGEFLYIVSHSKVGKFRKDDFSYLGCVDNAKAFVNTHQILKTDDRLYICNTSCDSLGILENSVMKYLDLKTFELTDDVETPSDVNSLDTLHANSVEEHGDTIFMMFTDKTRKQLGMIVNLDKQTLQKNYAVEIGMKLHNIVIIGSSLYTLSTGTGELIEFDLETRECTQYPLAPSDQIYLRGMVNLDGNLLISHSRHFKTSSNRGFSYLKLFDVEEKYVTENYIVNKVDIVNNMQLLES